MMPKLVSARPGMKATRRGSRARAKPKTKPVVSTLFEPKPKKVPQKSAQTQSSLYKVNPRGQSVTTTPKTEIMKRPPGRTEKFMGEAKRVGQKRLTGKVAAKAGARLLGPVGVTAATGFTVGEVIGANLKKKPVSGSSSRARAMAAKSFYKNRNQRLKNAPAKKPVATISKAGADTALRLAPKPKPKPKAKVATAKPKAVVNKPKVAVRKPAPVQEGPSRKPIKRKKVNRGYANYERIMAQVGG